MRRMTMPLLLLVTVSLAACAEEVSSGGQPVPVPPPGTLHLVLDDTYTVGETVEVVLANDTEATYTYNNTGYEACAMTYTDERGREFIIPPGTHCDLIVMADLAPGATATLFSWDLDECTKDNWGCVRSRPLGPGTYTIAGSFEPKGGGAKTKVQATFDIVPAA